jgi:hypothetical protein
MDSEASRSGLGLTVIEIAKDIHARKPYRAYLAEASRQCPAP